MTIDAAALASPGAGQRPSEHVFVSRAGRGGPSRAALRELWAFREVLYAFVVRRNRERYKQALFGAAWVVIQPVAAALVFALFLGRLAHLSSDGAPYFLFVLAGLAAWTYFAQTLSQCTESLVNEASVIRKVFFPREIAPLSVVIAGLIDLLIAMAVLAVIVAISGRPPTAAWLLLPLPLLVVVVTATAFGVLFAGLNVYYRDASYALPFLTQLGFFLSPVIYPAGLVPQGARVAYLVLNPVAAGIQSLRDILLGRAVPDLEVLGLALVWAALLLMAAYAGFKTVERRFADSV